MLWNLKTGDNLNQRHFLLNCRRVVYVISSCIKQYRWRRTSLCGFLKKWSTELWRDKASSSPWKFHPNKHPRSFLSSFCSSPIFRTNVAPPPFPIFWWQFQWVQTHTQLLQRHNPLLKLRIRFIISFHSTVLPNCERIAELSRCLWQFSHSKKSSSS